MRKLGSEKYGVLTTVIVFVGLFSLLNLQGTGRVLVREGSKSLGELHRYIEDLITLKNLFAIISISVTCIAAYFIKSYSFQVKIFIVIYSLTHIFEIYSSFFSSVYQASQKMKYISIFSVFKSLLYTIFGATAVYYGSGILTLILISIFSSLFILILSYRVTRSIVKFKLIRPLIWNKKILIPSVIFSVMEVLGFLSTRIDLLMISWMGTATEVGLYAVAYKIADYMQMIRSQVSTSFLPIFVQRYEGGSVRLTRLLILSGLFFILVFLVSCVASFLSKDLIVFLFGKEFLKSGYILSVLIFYIAFGYCNLPFTLSMIATHNEKVMLIIDATTAVMNVGLNYILYSRFGVMGIAYSTLVSRGISSLLGMAITINMLKRQKKFI